VRWSAVAFVYSPDGKLFLTCMQDGLVRTKPLRLSLLRGGVKPRLIHGLIYSVLLVPRRRFQTRMEDAIVSAFSRRRKYTLVIGVLLAEQSAS
jgi:hypothetical protein